MNIREELEREHSTASRNRIINYVDDKKKMKELMDCFFSTDLRICQRASWPITFIARKRPELIQPYHEKLVANLEQPHHDAVIRNTVRIYEDVDIPESIEGPLFEKCFEYLADRKVAIAIRAFSMTILEKLVIKFPELQNELIELIKEYMPDEKPAFKSRGKKILRRLGG